MQRSIVALATAATLLGATSGASAANACYQVTTVNSGAVQFFARLETRSAGTLVPANEGSTATPAQNLFEVDGYLTRRTGLVGNGQQVVQMSLITGTTLVVAGRGAQMSLLRNFGRGEAGTFGHQALDCGSATASSTPAAWICRGTTTLRDAIGPETVEARPLRLTKVNAAQFPQCREFGLRSG